MGRKQGEFHLRLQIIGYNTKDLINLILDSPAYHDIIITLYLDPITTPPPQVVRDHLLRSPLQGLGQEDRRAAVMLSTV